MSSNNFYNLTLAKHISLEELADELIFYVNEKKEAEYKIIVGTDSAAEKTTRLVTAVTILRVGNGGRYFWTRSEEINCPSLPDRIYKETMQSITLSQELRSAFAERLGEDVFWNGKIMIHLDVGTKGPTRELIDSVVGMVKGYGLEAVIKPFAFCASIVADRHT